MKYRIAAVSYVNTLPFIHGLSSPLIKDQVEVILAHPAKCAELLQRDEVDISLCPVGALSELKGYQILTDYCIGCDGPVRTVSVYSDYPIDQISHIVLSPESRTSNLLVQVLEREYWKNKINFITEFPVPEPVEGPASLAKRDSTGFLCIGDICFQKEKEYPYRTDLGQEWKEWTGLPFVFACWVSKDQVDGDFIQKLNAVFERAIQDIDRLEAFPGGLDVRMMRRYLKSNISYALDPDKISGMEKFLKLTNRSVPQKQGA